MSLQVWLPLNGKLNNQGLDNPGTFSCSSAVYSEGKLGKCLDMNKYTTNSLTFESLKGATKYSFAVWINIDSTKAFTSWSDMFLIYSNHDGTSGNIRIEHTSTVGAFQVIFPKSDSHGSTTTTYYSPLSQTTVAKDTWAHIAVTNDGTTIKSYVNGLLSGTHPVSNIYDSGYLTGVVKIGDGGSVAKLNDFRIYDHALSAKEVKELSKGLVCHYKLSNQYEIGLQNKYSDASAEGSCSSTSHFTKTKLADERGYNYKLSHTGTGSNVWGNISFPSFSFTAGKKYFYSCKIRCHSTNISMQLRAARSANDWVTTNVNVLQADGEWHEYYVSQTINSTYDKSGTTTTSAPVLEFYTQAMPTSGTVYSCDFDMKDIQVVEADEYIPFIDNKIISSIVSDCSGYSNNCTLSGKLGWINSSPRYKGAYDLNGTGYFYNANFGLTTKQFTVSFWVNMPATITAQHFLFGTFSSWTKNGLGMYRNKDTGNYNILLVSDAENNYKSITITLTPSVWNLITLVYTGTTFVVYVNGSAVSTSIYGSNGNVAHSVCYIGNSLYNLTSTQTDEALISDFRFYTTALTSEDIVDLYNTPISLNKDGALFAYEFEEV